MRPFLKSWKWFNKYLWKILILLGLVLYLAFQLNFFLNGEVNADEGWYLYAGELVYSGQRPYQDFAYTQTPLLPYIYGLPQLLFHGGLYGGRAISIVLSGLALLFSIVAARRYGGDAAAAVTVLLWATFSYGIYYVTVTKTYALTLFLFALTLFVLTSNLNHQRKLVLATIIVVLGTFARLSALFFAFPVLAYCFLTAERRTRLAMAAVFSAALLWVLILIFPNPEAAQWNLLTFHSGQWLDPALTAKIWQVVRYRIHPLFIVFPGYLVLAIVMLLVGAGWIRRYLAKHRNLFVVLTGLVLFLIPNLVNGVYYTEYFVPLFYGLCPIIGLLFVELYRHLKPQETEVKVQETTSWFQRFRRFFYGGLKVYSAVSPARLVLALAFAYALWIGLANGGQYFIDRSGGKGPIEEIQEVAALVDAETNPDDRLFAMEALWVAIEAKRQTLPNMTMAQFSFYRGKRQEAEALHLINEEITLDYFREGLPAMILLTDWDRRIIQNSTNTEAILAALSENYQLRLEMTDWGQFQGTLEVYDRRNK